MGPLGDKHNFGQQVRLSDGPHGPIIFKPRTVFWERMFLDSDSKFRKAFERIHPGQPADYLGNIQISEVSLHSGFCSKATFGNVSGCESGSDPENLAKNIGRLTAFSTIYGLTDLHLENILVQRSFAQLLDIECVFAEISSPLDTLLIPSRFVQSKKPLISLITEKQCQSSVETLLSALIQEFKIFSSMSTELRDYHASELQTYEQVPIRFLVRPTRDYLEGSDKLEFPLLPSEHVQLERGDIPYFFGYIGDSNLYYFKSLEEVGRITEELPERLKSKISRSFKNPCDLLSEKRIGLLMKNSIMVVASKLFADAHSKSIQNDEWQLTQSENIIDFQSRDFHLRASLTTNDRGTRV